MIDPTTKKQVTAAKKGELCSIKIFSWSALAKLEDSLEDKLQIGIDSFKSLKDEKGNEIGTEVFFSCTHDLQLIQGIIDNIE